MAESTAKNPAATAAATIGEKKPAAKTETKAAAAEPRTRNGTVTGKERERRVKAGECVADDGRPHVGRAVNGVVCSAHAVHYDRFGNRRAAA